MKYRTTRLALGLVLAMFAVQMVGCDNFMDPSRTGRFKQTATIVPVLARIDVIEQEADLWGRTTKVMPEDLIPSDLSYRMAPGDLLTVQIFELYAQNVWSTSSRRIGADGSFRLPEIGDVGAAGLTAQEFEDLVSKLLEEQVMADPQVDVVVEEGRAFHYTVYGFVSSPGVFNLQDPNLRIIDALAIAGGIAPATEHIYVIREVPLSEDVVPDFERQDGAPADDPSADPDQPVDIEELIEQLDQNPGMVSPAAFRYQDDGGVDTSGMQPIRTTERAEVDVDQVRGADTPDGTADDDSFIYVDELDRWVRVRTGEDPVSGGASRELIVERIIEIPYQRLSRGDSSFNLVIRPGDRIFIAGPLDGVVYIDGEIQRPGVYNLPNTGKLTLSRLVSAAGGLGPLAIPERVDLTRKVGPYREATLNMNLAAIRQRTEPDIELKPDDHIIIGTSWFAAPLAVIRNGFRATYGFGFLLDRNFGNDVFGAPPSDNRF